MAEPPGAIERGSAAIQTSICRSPCSATPPKPVRLLWLMPWPIAIFPACLRPRRLRGTLRWPSGRDCMPTIAPVRR